MASAALRVPTLRDLLGKAPEDLQGVDVAEMNLLCTTGLPGAEALDIDRCLARLDEWAARVKAETGRHLYRVTDPTYAGHYRHSEAYFRASMLVQVLQEDCGVRFNKERVRDVNFTHSKDLFIHGIIDDPNGGTCVSMPVLYVAVGRRLGYPLYLVLAKAHVFARWDRAERGERFNIEGAGEGFSSYPDEHYRAWPMRLTEADLASGGYLKSLPPAEELALFLATRGHCLLDTGRATEAFEAYAAAQRLAPRDLTYAGWTRVAQGRLAGHGDPLAEAERAVAKQQADVRRTAQPPGAGRPGVPSPYGPEVPVPRGFGPPSPYGAPPAIPYRPPRGAPQPYAPPSPQGPRPVGPGRAPGQP